MSETCLFADSVAASPEAIERALAFVDELHVDDDAGDLYRVLESVAETASVFVGAAKQVLLVTDGVTAYTVDVLDVVAAMAGSARTFIFDLGTGLAHHVAKAIARAGAGAVEYAADGESLADKVARQLRRVVQPAVVDAALAFDNVPDGYRLVIAPDEPTTLFSDDCCVAFAMLERDAADANVAPLTVADLRRITCASVCAKRCRPDTSAAVAADLAFL